MAVADGSAAACSRQCAAGVRASIASERVRTGTAFARSMRQAMPVDRPPRCQWPRGQQQRTRQTIPPLALPPEQPPQRIDCVSTAPHRSSPTRACMPDADPDDHGRRGRDWGQAWRRQHQQRWQRAERQRRNQLTGCRCAVCWPEAWLVALGRAVSCFTSVCSYLCVCCVCSVGRMCRCGCCS